MFLFVTLIPGLYQSFSTEHEVNASFLSYNIFIYFIFLHLYTLRVVKWCSFMSDTVLFGPARKKTTACPNRNWKQWLSLLLHAATQWSKNYHTIISSLFEYWCFSSIPIICLVFTMWFWGKKQNKKQHQVNKKGRMSEANTFLACNGNDAASTHAILLKDLNSGNFVGFKGPMGNI